MRALIGAGVDIVCIETMTDISEAKIALKAAKTISSSTPVIVTMTFDYTPRGFYTIMGVNIEETARELEEAGADIIGSNCGNGIENMIIIANEFKQYTTLPLIIQANAGIPQIKDNIAIYPETPEFMAGKAQELVTSGISIIGGCCGTTPEHIRAIRKMFDAIR
jgi:5-methyltetrahydrofolate--homocysteine methyltransferase